MTKYFHFWLLILGLCCACESSTSSEEIKTEEINNQSSIKNEMSDKEYDVFLDARYREALKNFDDLNQLVTTWRLRGEKKCTQLEQEEFVRVAMQKIIYRIKTQEFKSLVSLAASWQEFKTQYQISAEINTELYMLGENGEASLGRQVLVNNILRIIVR